MRNSLGTEPDVSVQQFQLHLHRRISYLAGNKKLRKIDDLISMTVTGP